MKRVAAWALALLASTACGLPGDSLKVEKGSRVKIRYVFTVNGKAPDPAAGYPAFASAQEPLVYAQGSGHILAGLEEALEGMRIGDKKTVRIPPKRAYGAEDPKAFLRAAKASFRDPRALGIGSVVQGEWNGRPFRALVSRIAGEEVLLSLNHPLAGKTLQFDVEVLDILPPLATAGVAAP